MPTGGKTEYFAGVLPPVSYTVPAGSTVAGGRIVASNGVTRQCVTAGAAAVNPLGYAQYNADGDAANPSERIVAVRRDGVWPCVAAGAINAGDFVATGAGGTVVAIAVATADPRTIVGQAVADIADTAEGPVALSL